VSPEQWLKKQKGNIILKVVLQDTIF
jgi:hypothetical protein